MQHLLHYLLIIVFLLCKWLKSDLLTVGVSFVVVVSRVKPPLTITSVLFA